MGKSNIEKFNESLTAEELSEHRRQAGIASGISRGKRKQVKDSLNTILQMSLKSGKQADLENIKSLAAIKGKNISVMDAAALAMVQRWLKGDVRAGELILGLIGEKPSDKVEINGQVNNPFAGLSTEELKKLIDDD